MNCLFVLATLLWIFALLTQTEGFYGSRFLQTSLSRSAVKAAEWLQNQQNENGTYGEGQVKGHVTAKAFHSLRLIGYPVEHGAELLRAEIIKNDIGSIPGARVGFYILGAMATCQDPQKFYEFNLIRALKTKLGKYPQLKFEHPLQYSLAIVALCSSGKDLGKKKLIYVKNIMDSIRKQMALVDDARVETLSTQVLALTCVKKTMKRRDTKELKNKIQQAIRMASDELLKLQINDSTFGENEITAALASQALLAAGVKKAKCTKTMRWLQSRQNPDGSFINLMTTIIVLPSLIGALPYDVQNIPCPKNKTGVVGENKMINVCIELQFEVNKYSIEKSPPPRTCVKVLNGTNAHDILKVAANENPCYNFTVFHTSFGRMIVSICDIAQRPAEKLYWMTNIDGKPATVGIDDLTPGDSSTLRFEYKQLNWD